MMCYSDLSPLIRNLFQLWAYIACCVNIACICYAGLRKQFHFCIEAVPCLAFSYVIWGVLIEISAYHKNLPCKFWTVSAGEIRWLWYAGALLAISTASVLILMRNIRFSRNNITPAAIKLCADSMGCGICYWREDGRIVFSNICMERLFKSLRKGPLLNGNELLFSLPAGVVTLAGEKWKFEHRIVDLDGESLHELIATDVTELHARMEELRTDNRNLARINREMKRYNLNLDEMVRQQEILQAKVDIHDEMNRLMISTVASGSGEGISDDYIFETWQKNALMLCKEASEAEADDSVEDLQKIAEALGVKIVWSGGLQESEGPDYINDNVPEKYRKAFFSAAHEAIANAVKHAGAHTMEISVIAREDAVIWVFANDGKLPEGDVYFTGGLRNLSLTMHDLGGELSVAADEKFRLEILFRDF